MAAFLVYRKIFENRVLILLRTFTFSGQHTKEERFALGLPEDVLKLQFIDELTYLVMLWSGDVDLEDTR